ncbi:glycosyltransferase family 1 protein [Spirosoma harenae]
MNLFFDHQTFIEQPYGGISRYIVELANGINATPPHHARLSLLYAENVYLPQASSALTSLLGRRFRGKRQALTKLNNVYNQMQLLRQPFDVFHATYYDPYFLPYIGKKPFVVTFHDMIHERYIQDYPTLSADRRIIQNKKRLAEQATKLIAVSESTKRDLVELLNIDPDKIQVIYHGSSLAPSLKQPNKTDLPYLIYVGSRQAYKNFQSLVEAIAPLLKKEDCFLVCAGGGPFTTEEQELLQTLQITKQVLWKPIYSDDTLRELYQGAQAFIYPSRYEGFGIPILEAFACDCPCIVSNTSSLPEVAGDAALYIDPALPDSIYHAVDKLLKDSDLRKTLIQKGRQRLSQFSWKRAVAETISLYQTIV